jgi:hypothetical protein
MPPTRRSTMAAARFKFSPSWHHHHRSNPNLRRPDEVLHFIELCRSNVASQMHVHRRVSETLHSLVWATKARIRLRSSLAKRVAIELSAAILRQWEMQDRWKVFFLFLFRIRWANASTLLSKYSNTVIQVH